MTLDFNTLCSDKWYKPIEDSDGCKDASIKLGKRWDTRNPVSLVSMPSGCIFTKNYMTVFFNIHENGKKNPEAAPICDLQGNM